MPRSAAADAPAPTPARIRGARAAAMVAFATNGALPASLLARYAEVKEALGLSPALFGLLVVGYAVGGTLAMHLPGVVSRRIGVARAAALGTVWVAAAFVVVAVGVTLGSPWIVLAGLMAAGCGDAVVDVAQNAQGIRVQEAGGRSVLNSMHAGWSVGAALGGGVGTLAAVLGVPLLAHLGVWSLVCAASMALAARRFLPETTLALDAEAPTARPPGLRVAMLLAPLALVALAGISVEDVGNNWSAVLLASERDAPVAAAGVGLSVLLGAQFVGRLLGDRVVDRIGARPALLGSLSAVVAGMLGTAWAPSLALTLAALAVAGLGCAITVPLAFAGADALEGLPAHSGVTWISWTMRTVSIGLSPAIGGLTTVWSLPTALTLVTVIAVAALMLQLRPRRPSAAQH